MKSLRDIGSAYIVGRRPTEKNVANVLNRLFSENDEELRCIARMVLLNEVDENELKKMKERKEEDLKYIMERYENDKCVCIEYKNGEN